MDAEAEDRAEALAEAKAKQQREFKRKLRTHWKDLMKDENMKNE
jgi:hypothetical protein